MGTAGHWFWTDTNTGDPKCQCDIPVRVEASVGQLISGILAQEVHLILGPLFLNVLFPQFLNA